MLVGELADGLFHSPGVLAQECKLRRLDRCRDANASGPPEFWSADFARFRIA